VTYQVLCRRHWRDGDLGPHAGDVPLPLIPYPADFPTC